MQVTTKIPIRRKDWNDRIDRAATIAFGLAPRGGFGVDDYLVSTSNQAAFNLISNWPEWPSAIVTLQGPIGSGKTHLVNAWQELSGAQIVGGDELEYLDLTALAEAGPVAVEDLHAGFDEASLFHLFNAVRLTGGNMLMTTREWPHTFDLKTKDLASRFRASTQCSWKSRTICC